MQEQSRNGREAFDKSFAFFFFLISYSHNTRNFRQYIVMWEKLLNSANLNCSNILILLMFLIIKKSPQGHYAHLRKLNVRINKLHLQKASCSLTQFHRVRGDILRRWFALHTVTLQQKKTDAIRSLCERHPKILTKSKPPTSEERCLRERSRRVERNNFSPQCPVEHF